LDQDPPRARSPRAYLHLTSARPVAQGAFSLAPRRAQTAVPTIAPPAAAGPIASPLPRRTRTAARNGGAPPRRAPSTPSNASATSEAITTAGIPAPDGAATPARRGSADATANA